MNTLSVNIHLMLASFYRPDGVSRCVLMEEKAFPSDVYAVASHLRMRGIDPADGILQARPRPGETTLRTEDVLDLLERWGGEVALLFLGGVNYFSGQWYDLPRLTEAAHRAGALAGCDLAHAAGNVPLACMTPAWISPSGARTSTGTPGPARSGARSSTAATRGIPESLGWPVSTPPLLSLAPLRASLDLFDRAGMDALPRKAVALTAYLEALLRAPPGAGLTVVTPAETGSRGCQLSLRVAAGAQALHTRLRAAGVMTDFREPDVVRLAPAPLFNTFHEVWQAARAVGQAAAGAPAGPPPAPPKGGTSK